jgi:hypothetical protein
VVANANHPCASFDGIINCCRRRLCFGAIHLYVILGMSMKETNHAQTILSIMVGFLALHYIFGGDYFLPAALAIGVLSLISDSFAQLISQAWAKFALVLGRINGHILLTFIFFVFLTPVAFLMRILKKGDALKLKKQNTNTVYVTRDHTYSKSDLANIW